VRVPAQRHSFGALGGPGGGCRSVRWKASASRFQIRDPKARADVEDNFRKTVGQGLGGAAVLIGAGLAYLQFSQQQQTAQQQFTQQQQQASHDLLISNQVSKGFEQLGNKESVVVRLGGIYALEGVMNTSEEYYQPVLDALSAFVRDRTKTGTGAGPPDTDIQAVLTVIGRRKQLFSAEIERIRPWRTTADGTVGFRAPGPDLDFMHIPKAKLVRATLNEVSLQCANLSAARLIYADVSGANLTGAYLIGTRLIGAHLNGADLSGADLTGARNLSQTQLDQACGTSAKLDPPLTLKKPCPPPAQPR
jgi:hypothetical protein